MADLKLQALDNEDLAVVSAQCQDAVVRVADLTFSAKDRRFALVFNRFDWATAGGNARTFERRRAGLRFEKVRRAQITGFDPIAGETVLSLLAVTFKPSEAPAGQITLQFAAGAAVRLDVDYVEAELKDLGAVWSTTRKPDHSQPASSASSVAPLEQSIANAKTEQR
jgi:hypothetical protein